MEAEFTVANFGFDSCEEVTGQSFTLNDQGPDGTGTPGTGTVKLRAFCVGFPTYALLGRSGSCYVYSAPIDDPSKVGHVPGLVAVSGSFVDEVNELGASSFLRRYVFDPIDCLPLDVNATYYLYFAEPQIVRCIGGSVYKGGSAYGYNGDAEPDVTLQFEADLYFEE